MGTVSHDRLRRLFGVLEARYEGSVSWRGGAVDRLLDERHAQLGGAFASRVRRLDWDVELEVTFSEFGERGSIDLLATRRSASTALVIEIKTELTSVEQTIRRLDVKTRLVPAILAARADWRPANVGRLLVILDGATNRRRVAAHATVLDAAFPARSAEVRAWLRSPDGRLSGLVFSSFSGPGNARRPKSDSTSPQPLQTSPPISERSELADGRTILVAADYGR